MKYFFRFPQGSVTTGEKLYFQHAKKTQVLTVKSTCMLNAECWTKSHFSDLDVMTSLVMSCSSLNNPTSVPMSVGEGSHTSAILTVPKWMCDLSYISWTLHQHYCFTNTAISLSDSEQRLSQTSFQCPSLSGTHTLCSFLLHCSGLANDGVASSKDSYKGHCGQALLSNCALKVLGSSQRKAGVSARS